MNELREESSLQDEFRTTQGDFVGAFSARPQNFAWFLGSGTSRAAGLPTAADLLWDMKRRYYCREESQDISTQDAQSEAVRERIQSFMESRGFPPEGADDEYPSYFHKIFADDKERQRQYLKGILAEDKIKLSVGSRVFGALLAGGFSRVAFTTNFDGVVETALADVAGQALSAYHLEGSRAAVQALNNEEFPLYCKLHGDFRYESLKNLPEDLAHQNADLSRCLVNAGNRFGFVIVGYSGRDSSVMSLLESVLETQNPFPHGFYWAGLKGVPVPPRVTDLLRKARDRGVASAAYVPIETFDALLLALWRNIEQKPEGLDRKVRRVSAASVSIPMPPSGSGKPLLRLNALPIVTLPKQCLALTFRSAKTWDDLRSAQRQHEGHLILSRGDQVRAWGHEARVRQAFGDDFAGAQPVDLPSDLTTPDNRHLKGFVEEAVCAALSRGKPVVVRANRTGTFLVARDWPDAATALKPLSVVVGSTHGTVPGKPPQPLPGQSPVERVTWSEALQVSFDSRNGRHFILLDPDIWIRPGWARKHAIDFLDQRRSDRFNAKYNSLLDAWIQIILGTSEQNADVVVRPFDGGNDVENPSFVMGARSAFSRKLGS
jgi:hypothetical protein